MQLMHVRLLKNRQELQMAFDCIRYRIADETFVENVRCISVYILKRNILHKTTVQSQATSNVFSLTETLRKNIESWENENNRIN